MLTKRIEQGEVIRILPRHRAKVRIKRHSQCVGCQHRGFCDPFGKEFMVVDVLNPVGARVGQKVEVEFPFYRKGKAMLILYIIPLFSLVFGAVLGDYINPFSDRNASSVIFCFVFVVISFLGIKVYTKIAARRSPYTEPRIINIFFES